MSKGGINIRARLDSSELKRGIEESKRAVRKLGSSVQSEGEVRLRSRWRSSLSAR